MRGGFRKPGWRWTRRGWQRIARRPRQAKAAAPARRKTRKRITAAAPPPEAPQKAQEQGRTGAAPIPAAKAAKPAPRPPRRAWGGKYDELGNTTRQETKP